MVLDAERRATPTQCDDLDGDGVIDEISFIADADMLAGGEAILLGAQGPAPIPLDAGLRIEPLETGSWLPLRMQPTRSPASTQHSAYISPSNLETARRMMEALDKPRPMTSVSADGFSVLLGDESGLIEAMRPAGLPADYAGSFLREFVDEEYRAGELRTVASGPVRAVFEWSASGRRMSVYRNGTVASRWPAAPDRMRVIACAYPYRYLASGPDAVVRYDQMLEMRRALPGLEKLGLFGRKGASLLIEAEGLKAERHEVWLDAGDLGWNVGVDADAGTSKEDPFRRVGRLCKDTYIGGGMHVVAWRGGGAAGRLDYRIGAAGSDVLGAGTGLARLDAGALQPAQPARPHDPAAPAPRLALEKRSIEVNRIFPNRINGWELKPKRLAAHNPQPAYFKARLENPGSEALELTLGVEHPDWLLGASLLSDYSELDHYTDRFRGKLTPYYAKEVALTPGVEATVVVPPQSSVPVEVVLRPRENTLGRLACRLHWRAGAVEGGEALEVVVRPTIFFAPVYTPVSELGREYATLTQDGAPLIYDNMWFGLAPEHDRWNAAWYRNYERMGFWAIDKLMAKHWYTGKSPGRLRGLSHIEWASVAVERMNDPRFAAYRGQVYPHDEVWEVIGGRKGNWRPLYEMKTLDRMVCMNVTNAYWPSHQQHALKEPFQYHLKLPSDVAETFYYCGRDERVQQYARMLVEPRTELFEQWQQDPGFMVEAGERLRQLCSFWISTQLHVTRYESIRRQAWWLRHHGIDAIRSWAFAQDYDLYAGKIMHWLAMPAEIGGARRYLLTDRGLGWMDMRQDMELITLVRLLREQEDDEQKLRRVDELSEQALAASQENRFAQARAVYTQALETLRPDLAWMAPAAYSQGDVRAEALPDLREGDQGYRQLRNIPEAVVPLFGGGAKRPAPSVDGQLDNSYLEQGATVELSANAGGQPQAETVVYVARDAQHLYVLFVCNEPHMDKLKAAIRERDGRVWGDDCVEVFIDRDGDGEAYEHILVNSIGTIYDSREGAGDAWDAPVKVATLRGEDGWSAELQIPFAALGGAPEAGSTWRMNFCRERKAVNELSAWCPTFGVFKNPDRFGKVTYP